ncbi:MAG: hypothetical protein KAK00_05380 [Nanoarchaeota archaeon]|nr:hypothetical protein [Nanoarchaeota archaeon]
MKKGITNKIGFIFIILLLSIQCVYSVDMFRFSGKIADPPIPFIIGINVDYYSEPLDNTLTRIKNLRTLEEETKYTEEGIVIYDLANLNEGYLSDDIIEISVCLNDSRCEEYTIVYPLDNSGGGTTVEIHLPIVKEITPQIKLGNEELNISKNESVYKLPTEEDSPENESPIIIYIDNKLYNSEENYNDNSIDVNQQNVDKSINITIPLKIVIISVSGIGITILFFKYLKFEKKKK